MRSSDSPALPQVFLSYSSKDVATARPLEELLRSPPFGYRVWRDQRMIERDWSREVAAAVSASDLAILLWSPSAAASPWVKHEWLTARALEKPLVPVVLPGAPDLPAPLQNIHGVVAPDGAVDPGTLRARIEAQLGAPTAYDFTIRPADVFIPLRPNPRFVGRRSDLVELYLGLIGNLNKVGVTSVGAVGMPGVGKTQLAVEFAYRFAFAFSGIHWVTATDDAQWVSSFIALARDELKLGEGRAVQPANDREWIQALRGYCVAHPQLLILMDNVTDPDRLNDTATLLGTAPLDLGCNVLFTTRRQFDLPRVSARTLGVLAPEEAFQLLASSRQPADAGEAHQAGEICAALGYLPLAVALAAAYLAHYPAATFELYRRKLAEHRLDTIDVQKLSSAKLATRHIAAVRATLQSQWDVLDSPEARRLLMLTALMREGEIVPKRRLALLSGIRQQPDSLTQPLDDAASLLQELALAEAADEDRCLRLHPLIREFTRETVAQPEVERSRAATRLAAAYRSAPVLEGEYAARGLASVLEDAGLGVGWAGRDASRTVLELLRRMLSAESTNLYRRTHASQRAFFLQQLANRAMALGLRRFEREWRRGLAGDGWPHFALQWRTQGTSPELERTIAEGNGWVNDVRLTPDGRIITASEKGTLAVWDLETGRLIETLRGHEGAVDAIALPREPNRVLSAGEDGTLKLWDLAKAQELQSVSPHKDKVQAMVLFEEGSRILTGGGDGVFRIWDTQSLRKVGEWRFPESPDVLTIVPGKNQVLVAHFSPPPGPERRIMNDRGMLDLCDLGTGERIWTREIHQYVVNAVLVRADGSQVLTAGRDALVKIWDTETWDAPTEVRAEHPYPLAFLAGERYVAVGAEREVLILDSRSGKVVHRFQAHSGVIKALVAAPDGRTLVSSGCDDTARVWRVDPSAAARAPKGGGHARAVSTALALSQVGVTGAMDGELRLWQLQTGDLQGRWDGPWGMRGDALATPDGNLVLSSSADLEGGVVEVLDLAQRKQVRVCSTAGRVEFLALDRDRETLFVAGGGGAVIDLWDASQLSQGRARYLKKLAAPGKLNWLDGAALTPEGRFLAMAASEAFGSESHVFLFAVDTGDVVATCPGKAGNIQQLCVTAGAEVVAFATTAGTLTFWRPEGRKKAAVVARDLGQDPKLVLMPGRPRLVTAGNEVRVWDLDRGQVLHRLTGHPGVWHLMIAGPREVLTASHDWTVTLWDIETGKDVATLGLDDEAREVSLAPDGRTLLVGDGRGDVYAFGLFR